MTRAGLVLDHVRLEEHALAAHVDVQTAGGRGRSGPPGRRRSSPPEESQRRKSPGARISTRRTERPATACTRHCKAGDRQRLEEIATRRSLRHGRPTAVKVRRRCVERQCGHVQIAKEPRAAPFDVERVTRRRAWPIVHREADTGERQRERAGLRVLMRLQVPQPCTTYGAVGRSCSDSSAKAVVGTYEASSVPSMFELPWFQPPSRQARSARSRSPSRTRRSTCGARGAAVSFFSAMRHQPVDSTQLNVPSVHGHAWMESSWRLMVAGGRRTPRVAVSARVRSVARDEPESNASARPASPLNATLISPAASTNRPSRRGHDWSGVLMMGIECPDAPLSASSAAQVGSRREVLPL